MHPVAHLCGLLRPQQPRALIIPRLLVEGLVSFPLASRHLSSFSYALLPLSLL